VSEHAAISLERRRILITGAASGIGRATAEPFRRQGAQVAMVDLDQAATARAAEEVGGFAVAADVSDEGQVQRAVDEAAERLGGLDGLVNAAGTSARAPLGQIAVADWRRIMDVNLTGTFLMCQAALPHLRSNAPSTIVNVSTGVTSRAVPGRAAYTASKAGVNAFSRVIALEVGPEVRVNVVCPGPTDTPLFRKYLATQEAVEAVGAGTALKRVARPSEMADAILYLTSALSSYVTGTILMVDGGK
jgi:NAD(P)-dependent dehydrogenase (short-subunit alcohol dehydrogenase family)